MTGAHKEQKRRHGHTEHLTEVMRPQPRKPQAWSHRKPERARGGSPREPAEFGRTLGEAPGLPGCRAHLPDSLTCLPWEGGGKQMPTLLRAQIRRADREENSKE